MVPCCYQKLDGPMQSIRLTRTDPSRSASSLSGSGHGDCVQALRSEEAEFDGGFSVEPFGSDVAEGNRESSEEVARSCGAPLVAMMQSTDFRKLHHGTQLGRL